MKLSVFVGTSLDGFIARRNGQYDFLPPGGGEPHGYEEFIASVDTILIGRNTFEVVLKLPTWPYYGKRVVVLSHRPLELSEITERVEQMSGEPAEVAHKLSASGAEQCLCRWWDHRSGIPARWPDPRPHDHACTSSDRRRHPSVRAGAKGYKAAAPKLLVNTAAAW